MSQHYYACTKCGHTEYENREFQTTGNSLSGIFGVETEKYRVITCARCKFSEIYQGNVGFGQQLVDLFFCT